MDLSFDFSSLGLQGQQMVARYGDLRAGRRRSRRQACLLRLRDLRRDGSQSASHSEITRVVDHYLRLRNTALLESVWLISAVSMGTTARRIARRVSASLAARTALPTSKSPSGYREGRAICPKSSDEISAQATSFSRHREGHLPIDCLPRHEASKVHVARD